MSSNAHIQRILNKIYKIFGSYEYDLLVTILLPEINLGHGMGM